MIDQLKATQETLAKLLVPKADNFVAHLYQARKQYRLVSERPNKGNKAIERDVISSYQVAQSLDSTVTFARGSTFCGFTGENEATIR